MIDDFAKTSLHDDLRNLRRVLVSKLDGATGRATDNPNRPDQSSEFWVHRGR